MNFINRTIFIKSLACDQYLRADTFSPGGPVADTIFAHLAENIIGYDHYVNLTQKPSDWEEFRMIHVGDNRFAFKCYNGKFIRAEDNGKIILSYHIDNDFDDNMIFEVTERENGYTIKSVNHDGYLKAYGGIRGIGICNLTKDINISNLFNFECRDIDRNI